jgi:N-acetyl-alpha-D-muramate 1-phosphate uridylyltransferase
MWRLCQNPRRPLHPPMPSTAPDDLPHPGPAQALVLAAGRGERMRPLTDATPKPLLPVNGRPLIGWHLDALARAGVCHTAINTAWLGEQIPAALGRTHAGMALSYSMEGHDFGGALETAGGIVRALPLLDEVFWVVAGDVHTPGFTFDPEVLRRFAAGPHLAHLWLVPNPAHHPRGDFGLSPEGLALNLPSEHPGPRHTYSTIALFRRAFFSAPVCDLPAGNPGGIKAPLAPLLRRAMDNAQVSAELYPGPWTDVGTPERLAQLNRTDTP